MDRLTSGQLLKQINDAIEKEANNCLRSQDLTMSQVWVLTALSAAPGASLPLKEIERLLKVAQPTAAGIVSRLELKGLARSRMDDSDRRVKIVTLTKSGKAACGKATEDVERLQERMLRGFSDEERAQVRSFLARIWSNVRE